MEIEARELRIGNIFLIDGIPQEVLAVVPNGNSTSFVSGDYFNIIYLHHEYKTSYEVFSNENIEPIPLTEEWLIKLGFIVRYFNEDGTKPLFWKVEQNRHIDIYFEPVISAFAFKINSLQYSAPIKHVYQLQNLYFALTGKELTYEN